MTFYEPDQNFPELAAAAYGLLDDGIITGVTKRPLRFAPSRLVRRGEVATILARTIDSFFVGLPTPDSDFFSDDAGIHEANINRLAAVGIVAGRDGRYEAGHTVKRGALATMLMRTADYLHERRRWTPPGEFHDFDVVVNATPTGELQFLVREVEAPTVDIAVIDCELVDEDEVLPFGPYWDWYGAPTVTDVTFSEAVIPLDTSPAVIDRAVGEAVAPTTHVNAAVPDGGRLTFRVSLDDSPTAPNWPECLRAIVFGDIDGSDVLATFVQSTPFGSEDRHRAVEPYGLSVPFTAVDLG